MPQYPVLLSDTDKRRMVDGIQIPILKISHPDCLPTKSQIRQVSPVNLSIFFNSLHLHCHAVLLSGGKATREQAELVRRSKDELKDKHQTET